jgi:Ca-activated chloride channel family protein
MRSFLQNRSAQAVVVATATLLVAAGAIAQQDAAAPDPQATISVNVKVVALDAVVHDKRGELVAGLDKDAFKLRVDGQQVPVRYFNRDNDLPLTVGLMIDTSGSETAYFDTEELAGDTFLRNTLTNPEDRAFVARFDSDVVLLQGMTSNLGALHNGLRRLDYRSAPTNSHGGTLLFDAIAKVSREVMAPVVGRRALVVMTDGDDVGSRTDLPHVIREAQLDDVAVYSVMFTNEDPGYPQVSGLRQSGIEVMREIAEATGGRSFQIGHGVGVVQIFAEIAQDLRSQYRFGFTPVASKPGKFHKVELQVAGPFVVQTRKGYVTPEDGR